ncbi:MAG: hypothetical protein AAF346_25095, partial [Pseudomonadota bacterium]
MLYKGEGLELVMPQGWGSGRALSPRVDHEAGWLARALEPADDFQSMWVDEAVLRCCNQAYDLAVAHRATEVGLEHLVHAMTLVVESIEVLRTYNVDVTTLRHESAAIIAADGPIAYSNGHASPANSEQFVTTLKLAADRAYRHRSPITIEDILDTLFDMKNDLSSRNLLSRHRSDWRMRTNPEASLEDPRERRETQNVTDSFQNTRIDALERMVHELSEHIAENRSSVSELLDELRGNTVVRPPKVLNGAGSHQQVAEPSADRDVAERLYSLDRSIDGKFDELARAWDVLGQRIDGLEDTVEALPVGGEPSTVEALVAKIDGLGELEQKFGRLEASLSGLPDRLIAMERRLAQAAGSGQTVDITPVLKDVREIRELIEGGPNEPFELTPLFSDVNKIGRDIDDTRLVVDGFADRFDRLDRAVDSYGVDDAQMQRLIDNAMGRVGQTFATQRDDIAEGVANVVSDKLGALTTMVNDQQAERNRQLAVIAERVSALEARSQSEAERIIAAIGTGGGGDGIDTRDALYKLNGNQKTLADAVDQLRADAKDDTNEIKRDLAALLTRMQVPVADGGTANSQINDLQ